MNETRLNNLQAREDRNSTPRKLGILAGTFEDGSLSIYAVPYPPDLMVGGDTSGPIYGVFFGVNRKKMSYLVWCSESCRTSAEGGARKRCMLEFGLGK